MKAGKIKLPKLAHKKYINILMLLRIEGWLLLILALFMTLPCIVSLCYEEESSVPILISIGITGGAGALMTSIRTKSKDMGKREAFLLTGLTWVILSLFGMLPFLFYGTHLSVTDAFFETMSGFTTTGASVLHSLQNVPKAIIFWRCLIQWFGGLGILLFTLAVVPMLNSSGGMMLFNAEVTGITHDKLRPRVSATAKGLWGLYILLTVVLILLLLCSQMDFFESVCYGMSTMSTGGFTTSDNGLGQFDSLYIKIVMTFFMFIGGINFALLYGVITGKGLKLQQNTVFKVYVAAVLVGYLLFAANMLIEDLAVNIDDITIDPLFQSVSLLSSTGILEPDFHNWGPLSLVVMLTMMVCGACAGSTAGGAKIDRFVILFKFIKNEFYKMMHPNAITTVRLNGKGTPPHVLYKTLSFLFLYAIIIIIGGTALSLIGLPIADSFFACLQAISNTGLGTDVTGINGDYSLIPDSAKWILSFIMLTGRLEIYTVILVLTPGFWKR